MASLFTSTASVARLGGASEQTKVFNKIRYNGILSTMITFYHIQNGVCVVFLFELICIRYFVVFFSDFCPDGITRAVIK